jgi:pseudaminic acid synthase
MKEKILFLGYIDNKIIDFLKSRGDNVLIKEEKLNLKEIQEINPDYIISYGYRHIIKKDIIENYPKIINLHIAYLPWNRGADPNFWGWLENTPKGYTIHYIDEGIDTGNILLQELLEVTEDETLTSSYKNLREGIENLFIKNWELIRKNKLNSVAQNLNEGNIHYIKDLEKYKFLLKQKQWDTPVKEIINYGKENNLWIKKIEFKIGNNSTKDKVLVIGEISGNHGGSYEKCEKLVRVACESGIDAVKLQMYTPDTLTIDCDNKYFQVEVNEAWKGRALYDLYKIAYTPWEWQPKLEKVAAEYNVPLFSTAFDTTAVDYLEKNMNVPIHKISSFETGDLELLKKIAQTKKPALISRGMTSLEDLELAYKTLKDNGCPSIAILHCISAYPAPPEEMNLATIIDLQKRFPDVVIGLSDHTLTTETAIAAVALGARIIEKHIVIDRKEKGVDSGFSLEPNELTTLVNQIKNVNKAIGRVNYKCGKNEEENKVFKRSLFVVKDIKLGEEYSTDNIKVIRPGYGLKPKYLKQILGKKATQDIKMGTPISWDLIESNNRDNVAIILSHDDLIFKDCVWQLSEKTKQRIGSGVQLSKQTRQRIDLGVKLFKDKEIKKIIMTGGFSELFSNVPIAENMSKYAIEKGVDTEDILKEEFALDTVGQLVFVKLGIIQPRGLKEITIVTHGDHAERTKKQAEFIFGKDYEIKIKKISNEGIVYNPPEKEQASYKTFLKTFEGIIPGDDKNILETLLEKHPLYDQNKEKFKLELQKLINKNQNF